jgi:lactate dehydrogenase-like 2-hydroxyacid dehydrogenase
LCLIAKLHARAGHGGHLKVGAGDLETEHWIALGLGFRERAVADRVADGACVFETDAFAGAGAAAPASAALRSTCMRKRKVSYLEDLSGQILHDDELARLLNFPNVLITAHQAFLTQEALAEIARVTAANLSSRLRQWPAFLPETR